jgi:hypothetical protein
MEAAMTSIILDHFGSSDPRSIRSQLTRRLAVLARARRFARVRGARMRLIHSEMRDPRWYADIGLDFDRHRRCDWIGEMVRAMGARP